MSDARSSSGSQSSGPHMSAPRDRGLGPNADLPSVSEGPPSAPWEPAREQEGAPTRRRGSHEILRHQHTCLSLGGSCEGTRPARSACPTAVTPKEPRSELCAPPELLPTLWPTTTVEPWEPAQQVRTGASLGAGPGTETQSHRPHGPGQLMGAGREGRTWRGGIPSSALGFTWQCVWKGLWRERQGGGRGAAEGPRGPRREVRARRDKALWAGRSLSIPHPAGLAASLGP